MKFLKFKLIPFLISLLIVIGCVTGICIYSYRSYDNNKLRFVADYFHYENYTKVDTAQQIDDFVKFEAGYYQNVTTSIKYLDSKSGKEYTSTPSDSTKNFINGATYENGVLHLPGYFDVKVYGQSVWNADSEVWVLNYYFYLYNVNYTSSDFIDHLYLAFVDGKGESGEGELYGLTKLDKVIEEVKNGENGSPNSVNLPSYKYQGQQSTSYSMYIHDNNSTGTSNASEEIPYVYRLTTLNSSNSETSDLDNDVKSTSLSELDAATFSIFYSGSTDIYSALQNDKKLEDLQEIVRGEFDNKFESAEDFNSSVDKENSFVALGAGKDIYKAGYGKFIWKRILVHGLVAFLISGVLAFLFYLIWQDDPTADKKKKVKQTKK